MALNKLSIYNIIVRPVVTDKATRTLQDLNKMTLEVHPDANKPLISEALKKLFNVEVESVRIINRKGKIRRFKRTETRSKLTKRAIITLKEGYSLDMLNQSVNAPEANSTQRESEKNV